MAVQELGMDPVKFWSLSIYEWSLWVLRIRSAQKKREHDEHVSILMHRNWMALYANSLRKKEDRPVEPSRFWPLPWDEVVDESDEGNSEEKVNEALELRNKRKNGG